MVLPQTTRSVKAHAQSTKLTVICSRLVCSHVSKVVLFIPKVIKADTVLCLIDLDRHASVFSFKGPEKWDDRTFLHDHLFILPEMGHEPPNYLCCWSFCFMHAVLWDHRGDRGSRCHDRALSLTDLSFIHYFINYQSILFTVFLFFVSRCMD